MGNQQKKDAKRAKRKKREKRERQIRTEQENIQHKQWMREYFSFSLTAAVDRLVSEGLVSAETELYQSLKTDRTFEEMQQRISTQIQLQANDPRGNHRVRPIPPRLYICKSEAAVATLYVSPAVLVRTSESIVESVQAFHDLYAKEDGGIRFACYVYGVAGHPGAAHFAILVGTHQQLEVFILTDGKWLRIGSGQPARELVSHMGERILDRADEVPYEDPFDDTLCRMADNLVAEGAHASWDDAYDELSGGSLSAIEPVGGELLSRVEDWVTQQQRRIESLRDTLDEVSDELESARKREREQSKEIQRLTNQVAGAMASLAARSSKPAPQTSVTVRPLKERMAEIFLG
jgi:hypothetical protein